MGLSIFTGAITYYLATSQIKGLIEEQGKTPEYLRAKPTEYGDQESLEKAIPELQKAMGYAENSITTDPEDLERYGYSAWSSVNSETLPFAVVFPKSTEEVQEIVKVALKYKLPVVPFSGGTSLEGHFSATRGGICISFLNMDKIIKINDDDLDCVVQPGVGWVELNQELKEKGLFFAPDPAPGAQIGGMVGTGCSGTNAARYGTMRENVLSLTVVMADGSVIRTRQRARKSCAGYNLTQMFIGSEGTLGIVTEATLKLVPIPVNSAVAVCPFPTIKDAAATASKVIRQGIHVAAIELVDDVTMRVINEEGSTPRKWEEKPHLFLKFSGTANSVKEQAEMVKAIAKNNNGGRFDYARNDNEAAVLWSARKEALWSIQAHGAADSNAIWTTDVAVPLSRLPEIVEKTKDDLQEAGLMAGIVGHLGDGNFHAIIIYDRNNKVENDKAEEVVHKMVKAAIEMEGTCTGEHGIGIGKKGYLASELGEPALEVMRRMKFALDPLNLMNPDHVIPEHKH
ncbi:D-lactate ferricytochrome c oxidoreductase [Saitoella coloradoensis]